MTEREAARDVKLHDRFVGTPYEHAVNADKKAVKTPASHERPYRLTNREFEILMLIFQSKGQKEIALRLGLKQSTVRTHMHYLYRKMEVPGAVGAVVKWVREQGLPDESDQDAGMEATEDDH